MRSFAAAVATLPLLFVVACADGDDEASDDLVGEAQVAREQIATGVGCGRVTATGSRTVAKKFTVPAGNAAVLHRRAPPVGGTTSPGQAFDLSCSGVGDQSVPSWLSDAEAVSLASGAGTPVHLS